MQATSDQIIGLTKLQHVDLSIAQLERRIDALPQKQGIAEAREKRSAIQQKRRALLGARKDAETQIASLREQEQAQVEKLEAAQRAIEEAAGDYRVATARGAELEEISQAQAEIAEQIASIAARLADIEGMEPQIDAMLSRLDERESALVEEYRREGGALLAKIGELKGERAQLVEAVGADIMAVYDRIARAKQGVALAHLVDGACNTCRTKIDPSKVLVLRSEYPLSQCPHCGRLMVVDKRYAG